MTTTTRNHLFMQSNRRSPPKKHASGFLACFYYWEGTDGYPLMQARNLIFRVFLGLDISYQKFVATPRDISQTLVQNLTKTARELGVSHSFLDSSI